MMIKYPIHKVAKDFKRGAKELPSKEIMDILTQYGHPPKNHMQPLTDEELSIVFEYLTQHNQIDSIESVYADVYHDPAKAKAEPQPAAPAAQQAAPAKQPQQRGKGQQSQQGHASQQPKSQQQPQPQGGGKPAQQPQAQRPATRVPEKKVVDTRGGPAVNLDTYDERLESFTSERQQ